MPTRRISNGASTRLPQSEVLFDENLSPSLTEPLADLFPGSRHVHDLQLGRADDTAVWQFAREKGFTIVTKDRDYLLQCAAFGHPPRVVLLRIGNSSVALMENVLREYYARLIELEREESTVFIVLGR